MVVLHYTGMDSADAALERLCDPAAEVSAHYLIDLAGTVTRLVPEAARAWHAGAGAWGAVRDVNSRSIGVELVNPGPLAGFPPFPAPQMTALEALLAAVRARWSIPAARVIGHSDMAPGRKTDPGPKFDWRRLALAGHAVWPAPADPGGAGFAALARRAGYVAPTQDAAGEAAVLAAFRLRFRPAAAGPVSPEDAALAAGLARAHPVEIDPGPANA
jgi:N-acetylmuramoyl-L-alanine amidase